MLTKLRIEYKIMFFYLPAQQKKTHRVTSSRPVSERSFAYFYSNLSESIGFFRAEFMVTPLTVEIAMIRTIAPVRMNIHPPTGTLKAKSCNHLCMV